ERDSVHLPFAVCFISRMRDLPDFGTKPTIHWPVDDFERAAAKRPRLALTADIVALLDASRARRALAASIGNIGAAIWLLCSAHRGGRRVKDFEMSEMTRRNLLGTVAAATLAGSAGAARAQAPVRNAATPGIYRYKIGSYELTALYDGIWYRPIDD